MARLQQKRSGRKIKREKLDAPAMREALSKTLAANGAVVRRFSEIDFRRPVTRNAKS